MEIIYFILFAFLIYILFCKIWPYFLYPNYFKKSKIENYSDLKKIALSLKSSNKEQTIRNVYNYMTKIYSGNVNVLNLKNLFTVFNMGDFSTREILNNPQFLWCHNQNRLFKSILVNTNQFSENKIIIKKRYFISFFIHQWIYIKLQNKEFIIDPYYLKFDVKIK